jgi:hypothetical protein
LILDTYTVESTTEAFVNPARPQEKVVRYQAA